LTHTAIRLALVLAAARGAAQPTTLRATEAWARSCRVGTTCGAYVSFENGGRVALAIVGAQSASAAAVELHETVLHNGQAHMRAHASTVIPAGGRLEGRPGKWHAMLIGTRRPLMVGDTVTLTFTVQAVASPRQSTTITVRAPVRDP
jgi:periplasmic copper chaperone A